MSVIVLRTPMIWFVRIAYLTDSTTDGDSVHDENEE